MAPASMRGRKHEARNKQNRPMTILVTGGAGFIGSHLVERLLNAGHAVRVLDNLSTGARENLPRHPALDFRLGDIRDGGTVQAAVRGASAIFHLAAVASVQASIDDPIGTHGTNLVGTLHLLEAGRQAGVARFVYASSAAIYGDTIESPVAESAATRPLSPYAADKLAGEHYLQFYAAKHGMRTTAFRFFNIYGPRQDPTSPYSGVISIFVDRALAGRPVTVFGDGRQTRDFVYVGDLVEVLCAALNKEEMIGQMMNVGRGVECTLLKLLSGLESIVGTTIERRHEPPRIGDIARSCANVERLRTLLGWVPRTELAAGLARLVSAEKHPGLRPDDRP